MKQQLSPATSRAAKTTVLALGIVLSACHDPHPPPEIPDSVSVVQIDGLDVAALVFDFSVGRDREIHDLWALASQPCNLEAGWANPMPRGVPGSADGSTLDLSVDRTDWTQMVVRIKGLTAWIDRAMVEIELNGSSLGTAPLAARWLNLGFPLPAGSLKSGINRIDFIVTMLESAPELPRTTKRTRNAFQLQRLALVELPESRLLKPRELRTIIDRPTSDLPSGPDGSPASDPPGSRSSGPGVRAADGVQRTLPDIVVIILDAARPDRFSCYGHTRPTTPNIDALAAESLVFTNAFALVPNTRRSVPTMVTGLSFVNHQVTTDESVLADEATTLAEALRDTGYRTACFTATPNNSRAIATDQGYDEFLEVWREAAIETSMDPHFLAGRVTDWLDRSDDSRPLHLQLHFVPPHAPYTPSEAFDIFSDPDYEGSFDGFPKHIVKTESGWRPPSDEDLEFMIARYDGNLLAADDAVGSILDALRQRPRWHNTVVLVTSDHGEAFFEHRYLGHNNTVYDEMLRVPFILRLPEPLNRTSIDLDQLVTLADITPTLAAAAKQRLDTPLDGIDLLSIPTVDDGLYGRSFVGRTAHERPSRCLRTRRWKIVITRQGRGELYDLQADPAERHNLRFAEPALFLELGDEMVRRFVAVPTLPAVFQHTAVSKSDREMLDALGYVN